MNFKKILKESALFAVCEGALCILMAVILALVYKFNLSVILGAVAGWAVAVAYYVSIIVFVDMATKKANENDVAGGEKLLQLSRSVRMVGVFAILILLIITKAFDVLALVLPQLFIRPAVAIADALQRKGVNSNEH